MNKLNSDKNLIQVFEYEKLKLKNSILTKKQFDALVLFNEQNNSKYFQVIHNGIRFCNYVGVIQVGDITIEILPKIDKNQYSNKETWHNVLLDMLFFCRKIKVDNISETQLSKRFNSILEIYYDIFLSEIETLIRKGLIKKYRRVKGNEKALKGKILFSENIHYNLVHKERFYCEHQVYDKDHIIHQIFYKTIETLKFLIPNTLQIKLKRIEYYFKDFKKIEVNKRDFDKCFLNRKSSHYSKALAISEIIILNYSPSISSGNTNMLTLLFNMNELWEEFIFRVLYKHQTENNFEVSPQNRKKFWENRIIKPDLVLKKDNKTFIIDTKWKIPYNSKPDDSDLKQMFSYNLIWKAEKSILLYPLKNQIDSEYGNFHYNHIEKFEDEIEFYQNKCKLGYIDILKNNKLRASNEIAKEIFQKIE